MASDDVFTDAGELAGTGHEHAASTNGLATIENRLPAVPTLGWSYGPPARPDILSAKPNPIELLHAVRRRWTLAIGLGTSVTATALALLWFLVPVKYEAYALLRVNEKPTSLLHDVNSAADEFAIFKRTQAELFKSPLVVLNTVREPAIARLSTIKEHSDDLAPWLQDQLLVDYPNDAQVLRVAMKGTRSDDMIKIVNQLVATYMKEIGDRDRERRREQEDKISDSYKSHMSELDEQRRALNELRKLHKTGSTQAAMVQKEVEGRSLNEKMERRKNVQDDLRDTEMALELAKARRDHPEEVQLPAGLIEHELNKMPEVAKAAEYLGQLRSALTAERSKNPRADSMPGVKKLHKQIQGQEEYLADVKASHRHMVQEALMATSAPGQGNNARALSPEFLTTQHERLTKELEDAEKAVDDQATLLKGLESYNAQVQQKEEEVQSMQRNTNLLREKLDLMRVERLAAERVTKLDDAVLANANGDAVRKYVAMAFTAFLSFGLVVLGVAFVEFRARKVNSIQEVNDGLGIRVVGELPNVSGRAFRRLKGGKGPAVLKALMAERIDGARTALIHTTAIDPPRVVMVTSAEPHEGKTTTATQLAASLARAGRRTILVDADIRNPGAHRVFELPQEPGLCELLRGEAERDAVIHPTRTANLWLMPAGHCDLRSVHALSSSYLGTAIAALCVQFDYVIIDSGPVLKVADPLLVGQHVDAVIVSVLRDVSKVPKVYEACERLRSVGITVLGSVVNGVNDDVARHGVELLMAETAAPAE